MPAVCSVCGVGRPERPNATHPICHACQCALSRYRDRTPVMLEACEREARMRLHDAIVNLRRVHAGRSGVASLSPYRPLPEHRGAAKVSTP